MLAPAFPPENVIGARRPGRFAAHLPNFGYRPLIVTASAVESTTEPAVWPVPYRSRILDRVLEKTILLGGDQYTWISAAVHKASCLIAQEEPCVQYSTSPPWTVHLAARRLKRAHGLPWVADLRDPIIGNPGRTRALVKAVDRAAEGMIVRAADAIVLNTRLRRDDWQSRYPHWRDKFRVIHNGFDDGLTPLPLPERSLPLWVHTGSLYFRRYAIRLVDALARLRERGVWDTPPRLWLIGELDNDALEIRRSDSFRTLEKAGLLSMTGHAIPLLQARKEARTADKLILFDHINPRGNMEVPAKLYDYLKVGRPILAFTTRGSEVEAILQQSGIEHICIYDDQTELQIDASLVEFSRLEPVPRSMAPDFEQEFSAVNQTACLAAIFDEVTARHKTARPSFQ